MKKAQNSGGVTYSQVVCAVDRDLRPDEQTAINASDIGETLRFVKENEMVKILSHEGVVFGIEPPTFVVLQITDTEPGYKGDTATGATKPATVETGAVINVPLFLSTGESIKVDTRTGEYLGRV